ncbi:S-methyl-5-thioribose-1-phosphate isomerase [Desulfurivibrio dismutans]|uniref:S-methyl-5-thioribose-1-phosphate isomerase n=1 Tax=Desulfurivibrio dismutans TaxID=1398908 RepID=UPI0023DB29A2|nr:S-methyl-5-thioribose-1-phosphate isomerase [Desulfurivibrio alkaliphilus]MDF1613952.1 S-methyl-5-thioribose-1-phosphate isomerase [Desulfurivibrio alkaliphilus]
MKINGQHYRTIWLDNDDPRIVKIIDQRRLPHTLVVEELRTVEDCCRAIKEMHVRGAGLIGATAAFAMYSAALAAPAADCDRFLRQAATSLQATRPTASNLAWAVNRQLATLLPLDSLTAKQEAAKITAQTIADEDAAACRQIGEHGLPLIAAISRRKGGLPVNILTHCNAGWLAFVDYGSATAPIYAAHQAGIPVHVWVDETRPWLQGARLTAWELAGEAVPHTLITDNAGGHLMQHGQVDLVLVGTDRTTRRGDVANKIGTYLKALAASDNSVPFYVALPSSTFDWQIADGVNEIPIEYRSGDEVKFLAGIDSDGIERELLLAPPLCPAVNPGFDVTPARLISGLISERGIMKADESDILRLYPEQQSV